MPIGVSLGIILIGGMLFTDIPFRVDIFDVRVFVSAIHVVEWVLAVSLLVASWRPHFDSYLYWRLTLRSIFE